jgi:nitrile hydratase subunit beta
LDGVHDMGGKAEHFGPLPAIDPDEPPFRAEWEGKAFALALLANRVSGANLHAFRHAIERVPEPEYLSGYYERWLASAEILLLDSGILAPGAVAARAENLRGGRVDEPAVPEPHKPTMPSGGGGNLRAIEEAPAFAVGDAVTTRTHVPSTHDRLPSYARGKTGIVTALQPAQVLPNTAAHFVGENPQHVYAVAFDAHELWGEDAEPFTLTLDLYESYLEKAS